MTPPVEFKRTRRRQGKAPGVAWGICFLAQTIALTLSNAQQSPALNIAQGRKAQAHPKASAPAAEVGTPLPGRAVRREDAKPEIIDSALTLKAALAGEAIPSAIRRNLCAVK